MCAYGIFQRSYRLLMNMITTTDIEWIFRQIAPFMTSHFQMLMTLQFCRVKISFLPDLCQHVCQFEELQSAGSEP